MGDDWYKTSGLFLTAVKKLGISQLGKQIMFHKNYEIDIASVKVVCSDAWMLLLLCCVEEGYDGLESSTVPEMQRSDLAPVILQMKALGVSNIVRFNFLSVNWKGFRIPQSVLHEIYSDLLNYGIIWISIVLFHGHTKTNKYMWSCEVSDIPTFSSF